MAKTSYRDFLRQPGRPLHVGVILMNGMTEILDVAPVDMLQSLDKTFISRFPYMPEELKQQGIDTKIHWITEHGDDGQLTGDLTVKATDSFSTCPDLDIVIMGAHWTTGEATGIPTEAEVAFVRKAYGQCSAYISICGGMMVPLAAGLLKGKTCTAPRLLLDQIKAEHQDVNWVDKRWMLDADGKTWTSGTLLNGLDLMRAFISSTFGGPGTLADAMLDAGAWPVRDVDYKDVDVKVAC